VVRVVEPTLRKPGSGITTRDMRSSRCACRPAPSRSPSTRTAAASRRPPKDTTVRIWDPDRRVLLLSLIDDDEHRVVLSSRQMAASLPVARPAASRDDSKHTAVSRLVLRAFSAPLPSTAGLLSHATEPTRSARAALSAEGSGLLSN
jgi:hypothetical protein